MDLTRGDDVEGGLASLVGEHLLVEEGAVFCCVETDLDDLCSTLVKIVVFFVTDTLHFMNACVYICREERERGRKGGKEDGGREGTRDGRKKRGREEGGTKEREDGEKKAGKKIGREGEGKLVASLST